MLQSLSGGAHIETSSKVTPIQRSRRSRIATAGGVRQLLLNARWALNFTWTTNRVLTAALVLIYLAQSILPAAQALATRGVIDSAVRQLRTGKIALGSMGPWLIFAFIATLADGLIRLAQDYNSRRLEDDLNLELNSMILSHAGDLDVSFFEDPASQDMLFRARQNSAGNLSRFVGLTLSVISNLIQILSLLAIVVTIEPLILIVIVVAAVPYMRFQWNLTPQSIRTGTVARYQASMDQIFCVVVDR